MQLNPFGGPKISYPLAAKGDDQAVGIALQADALSHCDHSDSDPLQLAAISVSVLAWLDEV
jgi:hypothetical protein